MQNQRGAPSPRARQAAIPGNTLDLAPLCWPQETDIQEQQYNLGQQRAGTEGLANFEYQVGADKSALDLMGWEHDARAKEQYFATEMALGHARGLSQKKADQWAMAGAEFGAGLAGKKFGGEKTT